MPADRDNFAQKLIRRLAQAGLGEYRYSPDPYFIEQGQHRLNLDNAFAEYQRAGFFTKGRVIKAWVASTMATRTYSIPSSFDEARANLLPYVRDRAYYDNASLLGRAQGRPGFSVATQPLAGDLTLAVAYDGPSTIASLGQGQLDEWGVSLEDALRAAQLNMRMRTPNGFAALRPGLYRSPYQDNHDVGRIVLTELISRLDVTGDPVAFPAHRDGLFVTGSEDVDGLAEAARLTLELQNHERRISGQALCYRGGSWEPFLPPTGSPAREPLSRARLTALSLDYGQQKDLLQKIEGEASFVASFEVVQKAGSSTWVTYSVWGEGVPTWLPITDEVALVSERFGDDKARMGPWPWADVQRVAGALMQPREGAPARVFVDGFPSDEMLREITGR